MSGRFMFYTFRCKNNFPKHPLYILRQQVFFFGHSSGCGSGSVQVVLGTGSSWFANFSVMIWEMNGRSA